MEALTLYISENLPLIIAVIAAFFKDQLIGLVRFKQEKDVDEREHQQKIDFEGITRSYAREERFSDLLHMLLEFMLNDWERKLSVLEKDISQVLTDHRLQEDILRNTFAELNNTFKHTQTIAQSVDRMTEQLKQERVALRKDDVVRFGQMLDNLSGVDLTQLSALIDQDEKGE